MPAEKILVLNATGKVGRNVCRALLEAGYEVYGTTRSSKGRLADQGVKPVACNDTVLGDLDRAFADTATWRPRPAQGLGLVFIRIRASRRSPFR